MKTVKKMSRKSKTEANLTEPALVFLSRAPAMPSGARRPIHPCTKVL